MEWVLHGWDIEIAFGHLRPFDPNLDPDLPAADRLGALGPFGARLHSEAGDTAEARVLALLGRAGTN